MRIVLGLLFSISIISLKAQMPYPVAGMNYYVPGSSYTPGLRLTDSINSGKKWFLQKYGAISTSFSFFSGGSATVLSAPLGLRLNRRLNNNLYGFAGVSVAPAYINFNSPPVNTGFKNFSGSGLPGSGKFGVYSRAELGLMYINDQKTFSVSGSFGVEKSSYPFYR